MHIFYSLKTAANTIAGKEKAEHMQIGFLLCVNIVSGNIQGNIE